KTVSSMIISSSKNPKLNAPAAKAEANAKPEPVNGVQEDKGGLAKPEDIFKKLAAKNAKGSPKVKKPAKFDPKKKSKKPTVWEFGGKNDSNLDFSKKGGDEDGLMESSVARNIANITDLNAKDIDMQPDLEFD